jgi:hypothetical protein
VPLVPAMIDILDSLPRFKSGDFVFTTSKGKRPVWVGSKVKTAIDLKMQEELQRIAAERGTVAKPWKDWVNHDLRRTLRSGLSALKIPQEVSEAVIAHAKRGIVGVYDVYDYDAEKREALEAWAARLHEIVNPPPEPSKDNVDYRLQQRRATS